MESINFQWTKKKAVFLAFFSFFFSAATELLGQLNDRPNILWITIEDTSPHFIGCYGNKDVKTPNIDKLAATGVRFSNAFSTASVCSSARSTLILGALNETMGTGNHRSNYPLPDYIKGFPTYLKEEGWYTSNNVKTDYATSESKRLIKESWYENSKKAGWWNRKEGQPFFCVFNFEDSHQSRTMTHPYNWYKEFVYEELRPELRIGENDFEMPPQFKDTPEMRKHFVRVYNSIALMDQKVGILLDSLEKAGLMDETIIFFYADHGEGIPRGKSSSVGIGYKVPFIIRFPEKFKHLSPWKSGSVSSELIGFDDLGPTILSMAGIAAPDYMTGRPFLGDFKKPKKKYVYTSRNRIDETPGLARSITDGKFMYSKEFLPQYPELRYQKYSEVSGIVQQMREDHQKGLLNTVQAEMLEERLSVEYLYNLEKDPWKLNNLANNKKYQKVIKEFRKELFEHILEVGDVMFLPEYTIAELSKHTTPHEYRKSGNYRLKEILETAALAGEEKNKESLYDKLHAQDDVVLYWALTGLLSIKNIEWEKLEDRISILQDHPYVPVQVISSFIMFDIFGNSQAENKLRNFISNENPLLALQALQLIQYAEGLGAHFREDLKDLVRKRSADSKFLSPVSTAETTLYYLNEGDLYYDHMKEWIDQK